MLIIDALSINLYVLIVCPKKSFGLFMGLMLNAAKLFIVHF